MRTSLFYWHRLLLNWQKEAKLMLILIGALTLIRIVLLITFYGYIVQDSLLKDVFQCLIVGAKFDCRYALLGVAPLFLFGIFFSINERWNRLWDVIRLWWGWMIITVTIILGVINVGFFYEYHDQFNHWLLGLFFDDFRAIVLTIWHGYPVFWIVGGIGVSSYCLFIFLKRWLFEPIVNLNFLDSSRFAWLLRIGIILLVIFLLKCAATLTWGWHSLSGRDTKITNNVQLNALVCNPYFSLYKMVKQYRQSTNLFTGLETFLPDRNLKNAMTKIYPNGPQDSENIEDWIEHTVKKSVLKAPEHIFLIIMESQDNWPLQNNYADIPIALNLREFKEKGIYIDAFLSSGENTIAALSTIITGIPEVGLTSMYQSLIKEPLSTSIAKQFKQLGYETNFFYGGYLTWQDIGNLASSQKFDHVYGCESIAYRTVGNEWGADDADFMNSILDKLKNATQPTFNLIMTTSNHDPHSIDLKKEGCPLEDIELGIKKRGWKKGSSIIKFLGHAWYGDKCVGDFVRAMEKRYPNSLFAITGDHYCRHLLHDKQTKFESRTVPLILYGPEVLKGMKMDWQTAGSHIDIMPTLIELIAPEGFKYWSMGSNILDASAGKIGFGAYSVIDSNCILDIAKGNGKIEFLPWNKGCADKNSCEFEDLYNAFHGIGWWKIGMGAKIK